MRETILKCNQCRKVILDPTLAVSVEKDMATTVFGGKSNDTLSLWFGSSQRRVLRQYFVRGGDNTPCTYMCKGFT